jgi:hypothetical protein
MTETPLYVSQSRGAHLPAWGVLAFRDINTGGFRCSAILHLGEFDDGGQRRTTIDRHFDLRFS